MNKSSLRRERITVSQALRHGVATLGLTTLVLLGVSSPALAAPLPDSGTTTPPVRLDTASDAADPAGADLAPVCGTPAKGHATCFAMRSADEAPLLRLTAAQTPPGLGPQDIQSAYSLPADGGAGQTIAIVDAYDNPNAEADLAVYRAQYGLPPCTTANGCFKKVDQRGGTDYPLSNDMWAGEIALDLDMVSAVAPQAHILLVETDNDGLDRLAAGVDKAVELGAKYVSNSYGRAGDFATDQQTYGSSYDHPGVAIVAASGDNGYGVAFPATLSTVTAVGGTNLTADPASPRGWDETVWKRNSYGPGSGCATYQTKPEFQKDTGCSGRSVADVSAVADNVAVYSTFGSLGTGWQRYGGTSASTPVIAGAYALAGPPRPGTYPNAYPYATGGSGLNDITSGSNGTCATAYLCTAGTGYDGPTGLGTPAGLAAFRSGPSGTMSGTVTDAKTGEPVAGATVGSGLDVATTRADGTYTLNLPAGEVGGLTVKAFGYASTAPVTVEIEDGSTVTRDFSLKALPRTQVRGTVRDGSGHGWPLYAKVAVEGSPEAPVWTDPVTGDYTVSLPKNAGYTLDITAALPGYEPLTREVTLGGKPVTADAALTADPDAATAVGYGLHRTEHTEGFDSTTAAPQGWSVTTAAGSDNGWQFDDPNERGNATGGSGAFAVIESDSGPFGPHQDTSLISPAYDLSGAQSAALTFKTGYITNLSQQHMTVDASTDDGATWRNVWAGPKAGGQADHLTVNVPLRQFAGQPSVRLRFHFVANWAYFWQVDDVTVESRTLQPVPGGLTVGTVRDAGTGRGVVGATVTDASAPGAGALTVATPEDPAVGDGLYTLFTAGPGVHALRVTADGYQPLTRRAVVHGDRVTRKNLALEAAGPTAAAPLRTRP
ncbi:carboxypeptidase regulatory-like domain-containing protein [Streptomyces sp. NPDC048521]|uniref:carboxypeptidase regulatory-like domain-containing protein n=1 Tax=Streptomyces sp. NPDC048521 TaxID=3365566 RepID=UPI00371D2E32